MSSSRSQLSNATLPATPNCVTPPSGLVAWYPGDGNATDIQSANNGSLAGSGTTFALGEVGQAFNLGGNGYVFVNNSASLNPATGITVDAWMKTTNSSVEESLISKFQHNNGTASDDSYYFGINPKGGIGKLRWQLDTPQGDFILDSPTLNIFDGQFHHLAGTYDGSSMVVYVDGQPVSARAASGTILTTTTPLYLGAAIDFGVNGRFFLGQLDEVDIFGRALTQTEIQSIFNAGGSGKCKAQPTPTPTPKTVQFTAPSYPVNEGDGRVNITVARAGDTSGTASVGFATIDDAALTNCNVFNGMASPRCDYENTIGTLTWAAGDATPKTFSVAIVDDSYAEGTETFRVSLNNPSGATLGTPSTATVTIIDNDATNGPNPIDNTNFFVRQQYIDFLGREPDPLGFAGWTSTINSCAPGDPNCDRIHVSQLFFQSAEFQDRGYFVYRFYPVAFGRKPDYSEFVPDLASVSGFLDANQLEAAKVAFIAAFMARPAFVSAYNSLTNQQYVDTLLNTAGVSLSSRQAMTDGLNKSTLTRAQVLRQIVESAEVSTKYNHQAYAVMEYFGYLRRQPDAFYLDWIQVLDQSNDPRSMVTGFVNSAECRQRFGPLINPTPTPTPTPTPIQLTIISLSTSSPLPMTPLYLGTTGINVGSPVSVSFSNSSGFSVTENPIRIQPDGTLIVSVPLYLDPNTKQIGPGIVSVVVTQSGQATAPRTLNIQSLPSLSSYGTTLGQITHAKLIFDALLLGMRINQIQTFQAIPGQTVSTSQGLQTLQAELKATIKTRSDVDRVSLDNSVVIDGGTLASGASVKFDQNALEMMDRVNGLFLTQTLANLPPGAVQTLTRNRDSILVSQQTTSSAESARVVSRFKRNHEIPNFLRQRHIKAKEAAQMDPTALPQAGSSFGNFLNAIKTITGVNEYVKAKFEFDEAKNDYDSAKAMIEGANGYIETIKGLGLINKTRFEALGMFSALFSTGQTVGESYTQLYHFAHGVMTSNQAEEDLAIKEMQANWDNGKLGSALLDLTLAFTGGLEGNAIKDWIGGTSTVVSYVKSFYDLTKPGTDGTSAEGRAEQTSIDLANHFPAGDALDIGQVNGGINISTNLGIAAPQGEIDISNGTIHVDTIADPSGNYQMFVPLNISGFDYGHVDVEIIDPLTGSSLGSETVDLSGLTPTISIQIPTLFGQCSDDDAGDPDDDDPDCD